MSEAVEARFDVSYDKLARRVRMHTKKLRVQQVSLAQHIQRCERIQRWLLRVGCATLLWVVGHSPEALKALSAIAKELIP